MTLPDRLGAFEIRSVLGEGGSAVVYHAHDGSREVALKVLHADFCVDQRQIDRFLEEAERMRRVEHRSLVPVLGAGCLPGGRPYIVMPLIRGRTLAARLREGPISAQRAMALFEDLAYGVAALHMAGLVHRDIKPENILWAEAEDWLVLLDLGIARDSAAAPSTTTQAGFMRGTPAYMAPERLFGQPASTRSDIYELSLVLCMMLTARLPWDDGDAMRRVQPVLRPEDRALMPNAVAEVLLEAFSFDVARRPPSVAALLGRVRRAFANAPPQPTPPYAMHAGGLAPSGVTAATPMHVVATPHGTNPHDATPTADTVAVPATLYSAGTTPQKARRAPIASIVTFVLGAAVAAGLALGIPAWRSRQSAEVAAASAIATSAATADGDAIDVVPSTASATSSTTAAPPDAITSATVAVPSASASMFASASASAKALPVKEGFLPKSVIESRLRGRMGGMQACVTTEAERPGWQGGRVVTNFWIGTSGNVTSATGNSAELPPAVVQCVLAQIRTIAFPAPEGGPVNVVFPVRFTPKKN